MPRHQPNVIQVNPNEVRHDLTLRPVPTIAKVAGCTGRSRYGWYQH